MLIFWTPTGGTPCSMQPSSTTCPPHAHLTTPLLRRPEAVTNLTYHASASLAAMPLCTFQTNSATSSQLSHSSAHSKAMPDSGRLIAWYIVLLANSLSLMMLYLTKQVPLP